MKNKCLFYILLAITGIIVFIFVVPPLIHFIVYTKSPFGFIEEGKKDVWISFFGSVIGGILTFLGVVLTLNQQDKQQKKEKQNEYRPILKISLSNIANTENTLSENTVSFHFLTEFNNQIDLKNKKYCKKRIFPHSLNFRNIGKGIAKEIKLYSYDLKEENDSHYKEDIAFNILCTCNNQNMNQFLINDEILSIPLDLIFNELPQIPKDSEYFTLSKIQLFSLQLIYADINNNFYKQKFLVSFSIKIFNELDEYENTLKPNIHVSSMSCQTFAPEPFNKSRPYQRI